MSDIMTFTCRLCMIYYIFYLVFDWWSCMYTYINTHARKNTHTRINMRAQGARFNAEPCERKHTYVWTVYGKPIKNIDLLIIFTISHVEGKLVQTCLLPAYIPPQFDADICIITITCSVCSNFNARNKSTRLCGCGKTHCGKMVVTCGKIPGVDAFDRTDVDPLINAFTTHIPQARSLFEEQVASAVQASSPVESPNWRRAREGGKRGRGRQMDPRTKWDSLGSDQYYFRSAWRLVADAVNRCVIMSTLNLPDACWPWVLTHVKLLSMSVNRHPSDYSTDIRCGHVLPLCSVERVVTSTR